MNNSHIPIYPEVDIDNNTKANCITLKSRLRFPDTSSSYVFVLVKTSSIFSENCNLLDVIHATNSFHKEVYNFIYLGSVYKTQTDTHGYKIFEEDESMITESERLGKIAYENHPYLKR